MNRRRVLWIALLVAVLAGGGWLVLRQLGSRPSLRVYCGGSMRPPMQELIKRFEARNSVRIAVIYNGCGILVGQMKTGAGGDVYYACDRFFMDQARSIGAIDESYPVADVTRFRPVILVKKGNPKDIRGVDDLARPGVRLGLGVETHGAVGHAGWAIIRQSPRFEDIRRNVKADATTADVLAVQLVTGPLDAVIIWDAVAVNHAAKADIVPIAGAMADQPIALMKQSRRPELARRFIEFVRSDEARKVFADYGFVVSAPATAPDRGVSPF